LRRGLRIEDLRDLLTGPAAAVLATYRADGSVMLSPVWFRWTGTAFETTVGTEDVKVRQVRRDPRVALTVFEPRPPFRGLEARGLVEVRTEGVREARRSIAVRYAGPELGTSYAAPRAEEGFLFRLKPDELRVWDLADVLPAAAP
jgi:PPOX class probable F420-dependent enzyme